MTCDPLPSTGLGANVELLLLLAVALIAVGAVTLLLGRRRGRGVSVVLVCALLLGGTASLLDLGTPPAQAATPECSSAPDFLAVIQTSTMTGLAPGVAPVPITGRLENRSEESTYVTAVDVKITAVTPAPGSADGCDPSDYRLLSTRMPVGRTLDPGGTAPFAGASIGFADHDHNQDACQGATVQLRYTANPS